MKTYRTAEIATLLGIHPNTVRFYEDQGFLPPIPRRENGYRVYSHLHLLQLRFVRLVFRAELLSNNLRTEATHIVRTAAAENYNSATEKVLAYQAHICTEINQAKEAIVLTEQLMQGNDTDISGSSALGRREAAEQIGVSVDILRDWERNGLIQVPRSGNFRRYGKREMQLLKIIATLRRANYSQASIRRMLSKLDQGETDLLFAIDTPEPTEDIISVADNYITSLSGALQDTEKMLQLINKMKLYPQTLQ